MKLATHVAVGLLLATAVYAAGLSLNVAFVCLVGAVFPKLDNLPFLGRFEGRLFHNLWFLILAPMAVAWPGTTMMALSFAVGALSHILLDFFSEEGVYPLWPQQIVHVELRRVENQDFIITPAVSIASFIFLNLYFGDVVLSILGAGVAAVLLNRESWE